MKRPLKRQPKRVSKYGEVGDIVAVPLKRDLFGFVQILIKTWKEQNGIVALFSKVSSDCNAVTVRSMNPTILQEKVELTGIAWKHWRVVGHQAPERVGPYEDRGTSPCFVSEISFVNALKAAKVLAAQFDLYEDIPASHPKLQPALIDKMSITMKFLKTHDLLSEEGKTEIATGTVLSDFSLTSDLLTPTGARFYDSVFKKDFVLAHFLTDTRNKLAAEWDAFNR
jgi:hypothetical protein